MKHFFIALVMVSLAARSFAASSEEIEEKFDRIKYESDYYDNERKITYLGAISLSIYDYTTLFDDFSEKDSEFLKLIVKEKDTTKFLVPSTRPRDDINLHFLAEVKRLFRDLPFHDLSEGRGKRLEQFRRDNPEWDYGKPNVGYGQAIDAFNAAELARRNALYGGRAGAVFCAVRVKRRTFPVLYEIGCTISGEDDLRQTLWREERDIGFSTPEHVDKELKQAITRMLEKKNSELKKIKNYGKK